MKARLLLAVGWLTLCALVAPTVPVAEETVTAGEAPVVEAVPTPAPAPEPPQPAQPPPEPLAAPEPEPLVAPPPAPAAAEQPAPPASTPPDDDPIAFAAAPGSVSIADFAFGPPAVTVGVGETVTWTNDDTTDHTATATDGSFDTGLLSRGESGSATFDRAGTFSYLCEPHPFMKGTVRVVAQASGDGGAVDDLASDGSDDGTATAASSDDAGGLPQTGANVPTLAITGLGLLLIGASGMRRSAARNT